MTTVVRFDAPGLPADWLNAWLAAIGVTALLPEVKLSWTDEVVPHAVLWHPQAMDLPQALGQVLPDEEQLGRVAIARSHPDAEHKLPRTVSLAAYQERAEIERRDRGFLLAASLTDNALDAGDELSHGAFDPPAPRGETLFSRAIRCLASIDDVADWAARSLAGMPVLVPANGLGFSARRMPVGVQAAGAASEVHVDPIVELLALWALQLFPVRGDGAVVRQRGWQKAASQRGAFRWVTWDVPLDVWAIDALLDQPGLARGPAWHTVPYRPGSTADTTRAYFSEPAP